MQDPSTSIDRFNAAPSPERMVSVVVPVLNEELGLDPLYTRLTAAMEALGRPWEVIVVDDGSTDLTMVRLREINARDGRWRAIALSRNFGKEIAVAAGLRFCSGEAAIIMDGDLQHPPEAIASFVAKWDEGYQIVYGQRRDRATDTAMHRLSSRLFYRVFSWLSHTALPDDAGDFRLLDRKAIDVLNRIDERSRFNKGLFAWIGFRSIGIPFQVEARVEGRSRWRPRKLLRFALDGFASFTTIPLRVWSYLGVLVSAFAFLYALVVLIKTLIFGTDVPGFPTLIISVMFFAGVQLISLGVIGEYLGRVYEEVKGRPLFIVGETIGALQAGEIRPASTTFPSSTIAPSNGQ